VDYQCPHCQTTRQWSCNCWQAEAGKWSPDQTERERAVRPDRRTAGWQQRFANQQRWA
jgi:hypothetical protein